MLRFVEGNRAALQEHVRCQREVHVVMGNEACDLDSTVSALALAYYLAQTTPSPRAAFIPVLNIPRSDFSLRPQTRFLLQDQGISSSSLIFRDEIDLGGLHQAGLLSLTLVDHHVLPGSDSALEEAVVEVVDHRPLARDGAANCRVTAERVGSCATLVTERIAQGAPGVLDGVTAALLHGTILLDCVNLTPAAGKVTPRDVACVALLESRFPQLPARDAIFSALQSAMFDLSGLTTEQMLRKDLKVVPGGDQQLLAVSAIYMDLEIFLQRPGLLQDLETLCQAGSYSGLVAMTISFNEHNQPFRQLGVYSWHETLRGTICQALEGATTPALHLQPLPSPSPHLVAYTQGNAVASRKEVMPILRAALAGLAAAGGQEEDMMPPPTPMNSLVEECPLAQAVPPLCPHEVLERVSRIAQPGSPK